MPKKILYESAIHQLLWAGKRLQVRVSSTRPSARETLGQWIAALSFQNPGPGAVLVSWQTPLPGAHTIALKNAKFYTRGDAEPHYQRQNSAGLTFADDRVMDANVAFFDSELRIMLTAAGVFDPPTLQAFFPPLKPAEATSSDSTHDRKHAEEVFHDEWAASEDVTQINVRHRNEACTAPEMRYIRQKLGDLQGRTLLDVGCGLGEASVYFAMEGAIVTATDISPGMCAATQRLAAANGVTLTTHVSAIEDLGLSRDQQFDIIYTGNTLHHADIGETMDNILPHLKREGVFVSWDPVAYNPIINLYRAIATKVRTEDEHPLRLQDIRAVRSCFASSEVSWFWLTTQLIFILMVVAQFRSPNKERFWKKVIDEADSWAWLYRPLAALDRALIGLFPFLGPLCWNVVIFAKSPRLRRAIPDSPSHSTLSAIRSAG
ncbi:MAG: class I SAM-dependent methyltransferase [Opitutus sp.]